MTPTGASNDIEIEIAIDWDGPHTIEYVIEEKNDAGESPKFWGNDYGLYQIYGRHILYGKDTLLYIGKVTEETFSQRFTSHQQWLKDEEEISIYLGRINSPTEYSENNENEWKRAVNLTESILIYKYSPCYNAKSISNPPCLKPYSKIILKHSGMRFRLYEYDIAPEDYRSTDQEKKPRKLTRSRVRGGHTTYAG